MTTPTLSTAAAPRAPTPIGAILAFSFLNSIGTAIVTSGIYFFTSFAKAENYGLGVVLGLTYIVASTGADRLVRWLGGAHEHLTARAVLAWMMAALAVLCALPYMSARLAPSLHGGAIWVMAALYSPLTGVLWPLVESYLSGGRRGAALRAATGRWNVVWSSAGVLSYWCLSPIAHQHPNETLLVLGLIHAGAAIVLVAFGREPGEHAAEHHEPHPPAYRSLLTTFRVLLPTSYLVLSTLTPYLPTAMNELEVPQAWQLAIASAWMASRVVGFFAFHRWGGWHGRWWPPVFGGIVILTGFGFCVMSPWLGGHFSRIGGITSMIAGLGLFGIGYSLIYSAAIYYALEVGQAEVQAGGTHEALIGVGYTLGPLLGFGASYAELRGWVAADVFDPLVLGVVGVVALAAAGVVFGRTLRHAGPNKAATGA